MTQDLFSLRSPLAVFRISTDDDKTVRKYVGRVVRLNAIVISVKRCGWTNGRGRRPSPPDNTHTQSNIQRTFYTKTHKTQAKIDCINFMKLHSFISFICCRSLPPTRCLSLSTLFVIVKLIKISKPEDICQTGFQWSFVFSVVWRDQHPLQRVVRWTCGLLKRTTFRWTLDACRKENERLSRASLVGWWWCVHYVCEVCASEWVCVCVCFSIPQIRGNTLN